MPSGLGTSNSNGNTVDSNGNVQVDFVWGNFPIQPNDVRHENGGEHLNFALDSHNIVEDGWNGYPLYTPNTTGSQVSGVDYLVVPSVLGLTSAAAVERLYDAGYQTANITNTTGTTAKALTRVNVTATTAANVYIANASTLFSVGSKVKIAAGTSIPAAVVNTTTGWTVTGVASTYITIAGTGFTVADTGVIAPAATVTGASGTVTYQSTLANATGQTAASTITITSWA